MKAAVVRRPLIAGNWKMHKTIAQTRDLVRDLRTRALPEGVDVVIAPPFTALACAREALGSSTIALGAQTMHEGASGPFTGEIAAPMLLEIGVSYVILGHSERRASCNETDAGVNRKVRAALENGIVPIVAVGESESEHVAGRAIERVVAQSREAFSGVSPGDVARCVVAYEPIWAIGTGRSDDPEQADGVIAAIRGAVTGLAHARLLYGGSMKAENAAAFLAMANIDGGLIGGASLEVASFAAIVAAAAGRAHAS